jgi:hypothetical protein
MKLSPRFRELVRHFLMRFYDNDLLSPERDQLPGFAGLLGLLAAPGMIIPLWLQLKFSRLGAYPIAVRDIMSLPEKFLFVTLGLTSVGLATVLQWDALFPDRRDYLVLCPLPLRLRTIFAAKVCSLAVLLGVATAAVTSLTPVLFPAVVMSDAPLAVFARFSALHLATSLLACLFTFLAIVGVQGLFLNLLPHGLYRRVSAWLQMSCLFALLVQLLAAVRAYLLLDYRQPENHWSVYASPPLWFVGLYQYGMGWHQPVFRRLAGLALVAVGSAAVLAACTYTLAYKRHVKRCLEAAETETARGPVRRWAADLVQRLATRRPFERAIFQFVTASAARSRKHRLYISAYAGLALAAAFEIAVGILAAKPGAWLYRPNRPFVLIPFVVLFVLLPGLRHTFNIPAELEANWIFRLAEPRNQWRIAAGVRSATLVLGILPVYLGLLPLYVWLWGVPNALLHTAAGLGFALIAREILLFHFRKIPFTCSYAPRDGNKKIFWALYIFCYFSLVWTLTNLELWMLAAPRRLAWLAAAVAACFAVCRGLLGREVEPLQFEDEPEPVVRELGLVV